MKSRVVHVYDDFEPSKGGGGVARYISGVAHAVACLDVQVRVVARIADETAGAGAYEVAGAGWAGLVRHVAWADVVHIHGARKPYAALAGLWAALLGRRVVYTPHCYYDDAHGPRKLAKSLWDATVERWLLRHCDAVILLSDYWRRYLTSRRLAPARPAIIPNCVNGAGIEALRVSRSNPASRAPVLLSVGRLDPVKRLEDAIRALEHPALKEAVLHIVGRGPDRDRLGMLAAALGVEQRVTFHGFVPDAGVGKLAAAADVFVLPSAAEGMPTVLIEMLLMGLPVVASDIPGNRAILEVAGLETLFAVGDVPALVEQVVKAARAPITPEIEHTVRDHFTWERTAHRVAALYGVRRGAGGCA